MSAPDFVSIEGIDKTGKTIILDILETEYPDSRIVSDPTQIQPWDYIFVNGPDLKQIGDIEIDGEMSGLVNSFLFLTARLDCFQREIKPTLNEGTSVISDRFADSWLAYQPVYEIDYFEDFDHVYQFFKDVHEYCVDNGLLRTPDMTILITLDEDTLRERIELTENPTEYENPDRLMEVQETYLKLKQENSSRFEHIRDSGQGIIEIYGEVENRLEENQILGPVETRSRTAV